MKCPCCGATELLRDTRDLSYTYKNQGFKIAAVKGDFCSACGEVVLDREQGDRYGAQVRAFQRRVNESFVDPLYIARVRKQLDLDQKQAAEIFGGGVNAFSRYENGKTKPPVALVKLLRVLERHPDLLNEVRLA